MEAEALTEMPDTPRRPRVSRYLVVVGVAFFICVVWYVGWRKVAELLLHANMLLLATAALIIFAGNWGRALKWRYALGPGHNAIGICLLSKISAEWTPGRLGEFSPMALQRHRTPRIGAWIMFDRVLEIIVTLVLGLVGLAFVRVLSWPTYAILVALVTLATVAGVFTLTRRNWLLKCADRFQKESRPQRFVMLLADISEELFGFMPKAPLTLAITIATKVTDLLAVCLLFSAFGYSVSFALAATAKCALAIVSFLPITPLATGLPHLTQAGLMNYVAEIPGEGLAAAIGVEVVIVSVALWTSGGIAAALGRRR